MRQPPIGASVLGRVAAERATSRRVRLPHAAGQRGPRRAGQPADGRGLRARARAQAGQRPAARAPCRRPLYVLQRDGRNHRPVRAGGRGAAGAAGRRPLHRRGDRGVTLASVDGAWTGARCRRLPGRGAADHRRHRGRVDASHQAGGSRPACPLGRNEPERVLRVRARPPRPRRVRGALPAAAAPRQGGQPRARSARMVAAAGRRPRSRARAPATCSPCPRWPPWRSRCGG